MDAVTVAITQASTDCTLPPDSRDHPWQWVEVLGYLPDVGYWINPTGGNVGRDAPGSVYVGPGQPFGFRYPNSGVVKALTNGNPADQKLNFVVFTAGDVPGGYEAE